MQETQVWSLIQEDPTCLGATKPGHRNWACAGEPRGCSCRAWALQSSCSQQEKPQQWEACAPQLESSLDSPQREKPMQQWRPKSKFWVRPTAKSKFLKNRLSEKSCTVDKIQFSFLIEILFFSVFLCVPIITFTALQLSSPLPHKLLALQGLAPGPYHLYHWILTGYCMCGKKHQ